MAEVRIQKMLADAGVCSRRKAEELMRQGRVKRNGRSVTIGEKANEKDLLTVDGVEVHVPKKKKLRYLMLYKPRGYVTTVSDE